MNCKKCGSTDLRAHRIVYEDGTSHGENDSKAQTPLAKRCSPPDSPGPGPVTFGAGLIFSAAAAFKAGYLHKWNEWIMIGTFGVSLIAFMVLWFFLFGRRNWARYNKLRASWEKSWVCMKCGESFLAE